MTAKAAIIAIAFACALAGAGLVFARDPQSESPVTAESRRARPIPQLQRCSSARASPPERIESDRPGGERDQPMKQVLTVIELHAEIVGRERTKRCERGVERGRGEHEGKRIARLEEADIGPGCAP